MNIGTAWVIVEESFHSNEKRLISIISSRKSSGYVAEYLEQKYVDNFASIEEKISFKKDRKQSPFRVEPYAIRGTTITCGHDPMYKAYYCYKLKLNNGVLTYQYRVGKGEGDNREVSEWEGKVPVA